MVSTQIQYPRILRTFKHCYGVGHRNMDHTIHANTSRGNPQRPSSMDGASSTTICTPLGSGGECGPRWTFLFITTVRPVFKFAVIPDRRVGQGACTNACCDLTRSTRHRMNVCLGPHPSRLLPRSSEQRHHRRGFGKRSHNLIGYGGRRSNFVRRDSHRRLRRAVRRAFQGEHTVSIRVWVARSETHRNLTGLSKQRTDLQTVYGVHGSLSGENRCP